MFHVGFFPHDILVWFLFILGIQEVLNKCRLDGSAAAATHGSNWAGRSQTSHPSTYFSFWHRFLSTTLRGKSGGG